MESRLNATECIYDTRVGIKVMRGNILVCGEVCLGDNVFQHVVGNQEREVLQWAISPTSAEHPGWRVHSGIDSNWSFSSIRKYSSTFYIGIAMVVLPYIGLWEN